MCQFYIYVHDQMNFTTENEIGRLMQHHNKTHLTLYEYALDKLPEGFCLGNRSRNNELLPKILQI